MSKANPTITTRHSQSISSKAEAHYLQITVTATFALTSTVFKSIAVTYFEPFGIGHFAEGARFATLAQPYAQIPPDPEKISFAAAAQLLL